MSERSHNAIRGQDEVQAQLLNSSKSAYAEFVSKPETLRPEGFNELGDRIRAACDRYIEYYPSSLEQPPDHNRKILESLSLGGSDASVPGAERSWTVQGFRQPTSNPRTNQTKEILSSKIVAFYLVMCLASRF